MFSPSRTGSKSEEGVQAGSDSTCKELQWNRSQLFIDLMMNEILSEMYILGMQLGEFVVSEGAQ